MTLKLEYSSSCSSLEEVEILMVNLPIHDFILNVLERSSHQFSQKLQNFELVYLQNSGYFVLSINNVAASTQCYWTMSTNPPITAFPVSVGPTGKSVNDVLISNYGMEITFTYEPVPSNKHYVPIYDYLSGKVKPWKKIVSYHKKFNDK